MRRRAGPRTSRRVPGSGGHCAGGQLGALTVGSATDREPAALAPAGVAVEVPERGHGSIGRGVAQPPGGADGGRAGVVRVGDGQLGRGQDRLAGGVADLRRRPRRSGRPGARGRRRCARGRGRGRSGPRASAAPGSTGCRGRGTRWRRRRGARRPAPSPRGWCRGSRRRRSRPGCCGSSAGGSLASIAARRSSGSGSRRRSAVAGDGVGGDHAPPAGRRQHDDVGAGRQRLGGEGRGGLEGLLDRGRPGDAGLPARPVEHRVVAGQRAGVARRGPLPALGGAALHERRAASRPPPRPGAVEKAAAVADALDVGQATPRWPGRRRRSRGSRRRRPRRRCRPRPPG